MTRFNTAVTGRNKTVNHEGALAYKLNPELELYAAVVTTALDNKFYESSDDRVERIRNLIKKVDPTFVAKLAVYAREKMYLRTIPLCLIVELAKVHNGDDLVGRMTAKVVQRVDEITELLGYYEKSNSRTAEKKLNKISNQIINGLKVSFNNFDEYQFAKYDREGGVKLKDALFLVHPTATGKTKKERDAKQKVFDKIVTGTLDKPYTWEVELSELGQQKFENTAAKELAFKKKWEELIDAKNDEGYPLLGYMALLRNLRNILEANVSAKHILKVASRLGNPKEVVRSKQFPFRFLSAYNEIEKLAKGHAPIIIEALEDAMIASAENIKGFNIDTRVLIACDVSGSMTTNISEKSTVRNYDVGLTLGMLLNNKCKNVVTGVFGDDWKTVALPKKQILANVHKMDKLGSLVGWSTNGYKVIQKLRKDKEVMDKVMIFTDCQLWDSSSGYGADHHLKTEWEQYKKEVAPEAQLYLFDLAGYGNTPIDVSRKDVSLIAGWSDKVFEVLDALQKGGSAIGEIDKIEL